MKKKVCDKCSREITACNYKQHNSVCKGEQQEGKVRGEWRLANGKYKCPYCGVEKVKKGIYTHVWRIHGEGVNFNSNLNYVKGTRVAWNKGLTKQTDERVKRHEEQCRLSVKVKKQLGTWRKVKPIWSEEVRRNLSIRQSLHNTGGRCKWFEVAGKRVQGTWERDLAVKFEEFGLKWSKPKVNKEVFLYKVEGKERAYTPDFYLEELDLFFEVKGYWWGNDKEKMQLVLKQNLELRERLKLVMKSEFNELIQVKTRDELISVLGRCGHIALV